MKSFVIRVRVRLKDGIRDPQSEAIRTGLHRLQFTQVEEVQLEKSFDLSLKAESETQALQWGREMARSLLANRVMEDFEVTLVS
jgi:phosphoribosylformylglycinamidine synthase